MPADEGPPPDEVLAALVASLRQELADALSVLEETRAELAARGSGSLRPRIPGQVSASLPSPRVVGQCAVALPGLAARCTDAGRLADDLRVCG